MNRRLEMLLAVLVIFGLVIFLIWFLFRNTDSQKIVEPVPNNGNINRADESVIVPTVPLADVLPPEVVSAQTIAQVFIERFGSYSSESDYKNIDDVMALASPNFVPTLTRIANEARAAANVGDAYYGISTKVISQNILKEDENSAQIKATTQRFESVGSPANTIVRYQDITVTLLKNGDSWQISGLTWAE